MKEVVSVDLLTSRQVADLLDISVRSVFRLVEQGRLPQPRRWSRKLVRWSRAEVLEFCERKTDAPRTQS